MLAAAGVEGGNMSVSLGFVCEQAQCCRFRRRLCVCVSPTGKCCRQDTHRMQGFLGCGVGRDACLPVVRKCCYQGRAVPWA